ncbi:acylamino-acid-releasing enzyme [Myroides odoratimimus]|uniref:alpha/beta hydrolase family protein n=1 Tax=Myroides odoratimimus TaxID=76832 RepID=UPI0007255A5D|nr:prolyl oligopeptidase family serine peptidase [Myroides odoratimimus]MDM1033735.1 S9 family peptidase [Myroides odoratimimus]MDM1067313.1 S9 family peptidase [Myroides odoratimimus]MDM1086202.1 S9 family peptidase [Myroides odoratimimus]MDM1510961.1 S9 family peptidase [Myroides odoratimimus]MEC4095381.1 prolyl oligopeptidase family serine peptidase [Myroides odoratimimus]
MTTKTLNLTYSLILILLGSLTCYSQTIKDSTYYSKLDNTLLSSNGNFSVTNKHFLFDSKKDSVFIFNNSGKLLLAKPTNNRFEFLKNDMLIEINSSETEIVFWDPNTSKSESILNVSELQIINNHNLIFYLDTKTDRYKLIKVLPSKNQEIWSESKALVNFKSISNNKQHLLIQYSDLTKGVELINLETLKRTVNPKINNSIKSAIWDKKLPIIFLSPNKKHDNNFPYLIFFNYNTNLIKVQELNPEITYGIPEAINEFSFKTIQYYHLGNKPYNTEKLQIWSTKDLNLVSTINYPKIKRTRTNGHIIFDYKNTRIYQPDTLYNYNSISLKNNTLLVFNPNQYNNYSYSNFARHKDIYCYDINKAKFTLITKAQTNSFNTTSLSSQANYFVYIKKKIMYFYNIEQKALENTFDLKEDPSRLRYWSKDEKYFYFSSGNKLMQYNTRSKKFKVLIDGGNTNYRYKILNSLASSLYNQTSQIPSNIILDNSKLLIEKYNIKEATTSIVLLDSGKQIPIIDNTNDQVSNVKFSDDFKTITYTLENFNKPVTVYIYHNGKNKLLLENSMPKKIYNWKKQKIVTFKDKFDNDLKGVLFYPKDFDPNKKYPMITYTYEIQNYIAKQFTYKSYQNADGFNKELYLDKGYFVFYPDILTNKQGPGLSALDCIEESIKTILLQEKAIDKDKIGLIGYSFGGYTTNFIITQTNIFKTAVSGAGITDIISFNFLYNEAYSTPNYGKLENDQFNMKKSFKEDKKLYLKNSPILYTENINTPLLSFTGKKDKVVNPKQQEELFMAMLSNNKPHVSLFYEEEEHAFRLKENQIDITNRVMNWFDYFLKDKKTKETYWVEYNTTIEKERLINN